MKKSNDIKIISFDCYGTLIDWDRGIREFFVEILSDKNQKLIDKIIKRWEIIQFHLIKEKHLSYEELLNKSFTQTFGELDLYIKANLGKKLLDKIVDFNSFSDVFPVLSYLKKHYKLVIISNGPYKILTKNAQRMGIKFDQIISGEKIGFYKPATEVFQNALKQMNISASHILHVAAGYKYDVIPAKTLGIKIIWVNRKKIKIQEDIAPDYEMSDLTSLPSILGLI